jgi:MFS family permease
MGIIAIALVGGWLAERSGIGAVLGLLAVVQGLASAAALLIHEPKAQAVPPPMAAAPRGAAGPARPGRPEHAHGRRRDAALGSFLAAMVLFHTANAPGGVYLGLFLSRDLHASRHQLAAAFIVSMVAWMLVVWPAGRLADCWGRRPLLIAAWVTMSLRLALIAWARHTGHVVVYQALDGLANGLFAVLAAAWVTDRLGGAPRAGEAQAIVGTSLVFGSALGPAVSAPLVGSLGYRGLFGLLAAVGALATVLVITAVPETLLPGAGNRRDRIPDAFPELVGPSLAPGETVPS